MTRPTAGARPLRHALTALALLGALALHGSTAERIPAEKIADGLVYARYEVGETLGHVLKFELDAKDLRVRSLKAEGKERLYQMVQRLEEAGESVVGAVNGDFFHMDTKAGVPFGLQVADGRLIFGPAGLSMIGFGADNTPFIGIVKLKATVEIQGYRKKVPIDGVNTFESDIGRSSGVYLYTPEFQEVEIDRYDGIAVSVEKVTPHLRVGDECAGAISELLAGGGETLTVPDDGCLLYFLGNAATALRGDLKKGAKVSLDIALPPIRGAVSQAIGGCPRIVRSGKASVEFDKEDFPRLHAREINNRSRARTAVGYDRGRKSLFLVVVEEGKEGIKGMTMGELAEFMVKLGCYDAMALDGGGSAAMFVQGRGIVSASADDTTGSDERRIANSLLITRRGPAPADLPAKPPTTPGARPSR